MDYHSISRLFVRTAGVLVIVYTAVLVPESVHLSIEIARQPGADWYYVAWPWIPLIFVAALGLALLYFPSSVTRSTVAVSTEDARYTAQLQLVAGFTLGLYLSIAGLADIAYAFGELTLFQLVNAHNEDFKLPSMHPRTLGRYLAGTVKLLAGLILFFGTPGLVRLWQCLRGGDA